MSQPPDGRTRPHIPLSVYQWTALGILTGTWLTHNQLLTTTLTDSGGVTGDQAS
ncbi:MAG TPA: hypothetical protein G4O08_07465 [Anaerolineae bacterium]|nr:hypothetical protein [Anaerolineae bacterium]